MLEQIIINEGLEILKGKKPGTWKLKDREKELKKYLKQHKKEISLYGLEELLYEINKRKKGLEKGKERIRENLLKTAKKEYGRYATKETTEIYQEALETIKGKKYRLYEDRLRVMDALLNQTNKETSYQNILTLYDMKKELEKKYLQKKAEKNKELKEKIEALKEKIDKKIIYERKKLEKATKEQKEKRISTKINKYYGKIKELPVEAYENIKESYTTTITNIKDGISNKISSIGDKLKKPWKKTKETTTETREEEISKPTGKDYLKRAIKTGLLTTYFLIILGSGTKPGIKTNNYHALPDSQYQVRQITQTINKEEKKKTRIEEETKKTEEEIEKKKPAEEYQKTEERQKINQQTKKDKQLQEPNKKKNIEDVIAKEKTIQENKTNKDEKTINNNKIIKNKTTGLQTIIEKLYLNKEDEKRNHLLINGEKQEAYLVRNHQIIEKYSVSTGKNGFGEQYHSGRTPRGLLKVERIIGKGLPKGTIIKNQIPQKDHYGRPKIATIYKQKIDLPEDVITTRVIILDGKEKENKNTIYRGIYMHGTNEEGLLGTKASHGCIRFSNNAIIELADKYLQPGSSIYILEKEPERILANK